MSGGSSEQTGVFASGEEEDVEGTRDESQQQREEEHDELPVSDVLPPLVQEAEEPEVIGPRESLAALVPSSAVPTRLFFMFLPPSPTRCSLCQPPSFFFSTPLHPHPLSLSLSLSLSGSVSGSV